MPKDDDIKMHVPSESKQPKQTSSSSENKETKDSKKLALKSHKRKHEALQSQKSILHFFKIEESKKRTKFNKKIEEEHKKEQKASVVISYRDDGRGQGAYYDHYTTQLLTGAPTAIASSSDKSTRDLVEYLRTVTYDLQFGDVDEAQSRHVPPSLEQVNKSSGLLLIPGVARSTLDRRKKDYQARKTNEEKLIQQAINKGQPILAICGGSWQLWEYFGGKVKEVKEHNCRSGMPRIKDSTGKIGHNIQIHRIQIDEKASILKSAMAYNRLGHTADVNFSVNSVHWQACDAEAKETPDCFQVSAVAIRDDKLAPKNNKGEKMQPEEGTVEAVESKNGAPILGIQWHPDAYTKNTPAKYHPVNQQHLIKYMAQAGQTYKNRQTLVADFQQKFTPDAKLPLRSTSLIVKHNEVKRITNTTKGTIEFKRVGFCKSKQKRHICEIETEIRMKEEYLREKMNSEETESKESKINYVVSTLKP